MSPDEARAALATARARVERADDDCAEARQRYEAAKAERRAAHEARAGAIRRAMLIARLGRRETARHAGVDETRTISRALATGP